MPASAPANAFIIKGLTTIRWGTGGNAVTLEYDAPVAGQFSTGTFTAIGTTQTINVVGTGSTQLNAIQLRSNP